VPLAFAGLFVVPVAVLQMKPTDTNLPAWARGLWGNDKDGDGDDGWRTDHYPNGAWTGFWPRFLWFAIRNPCYNFSERYGAVSLEGRKFTVTDTGDPDTTNRGYCLDWANQIFSGHSGVFRRVLEFDDGQVVPMYYLVRQWGSSGMCLRVLLGWKLMGDNIKGSTVEPVFHINPFMGFQKVEKLS
jgi:hypothetical protein